jgi:arylsulfatase A-like enzyme
MRTLPIPNRSGLAANEISLADALRSGGYATGIFGKWHLGGPDGCTPGQQGFDVVMDVDHSGRGVSDDPKGIYAITRAAGEFMESNRDKPFFAYVSHHAIHTALQFHQATLDRFKNKSLSQEQSGGGYDAANQRSAVTGNDNHNNGPQHTNRQYAACTFDFDNAVGLLLKQIDELGLRENTLVIFTSDNGATPQSSQEPLRGNKGSYHEGGIREPFIARWPGRIAPGSKCDTPIINIDLFPTFLDAGGIAVPAGKVLDGESLVGLMTHGDTLKRKSIFWHFPGYLDRPVPRGRDPIFRTRPVSVINRDHWKLYLYHEEWSLDGGREGIDSNGAVELYNLRDDIGERIDLAGTNIAKRDELLDELLKWFESAGAKLASEPNPNFDPNFQSRKDRPGEEPAAKANAINAATKTAPDSG